MAKFQKRIDIVEAEQVTTRHRVTINTAGSLVLTADLMADPGEWIVKGALGDTWVCSDAVFQRLYEPMAVQREHEGSE